MLEIPKKPSKKAVLAAAKVVADLMAVLGGDQASDGAVAEDIAHSFRHCQSYDGYALAKSLEARGWLCDADDVFALSFLRLGVSVEHRKELREYREKHQVALRQKPGDRVAVAGREGYGLVVAALPDLMMYAVAMDDEQKPGEATLSRTFFFDEVKEVPA